MKFFTIHSLRHKTAFNKHGFNVRFLKSFFSEYLGKDWHLVTHPLSANNRLNRSPYRSVVLSEKPSWEGDDREVLGRAIEHLSLQGFDDPKGADADYRWIDLEHLKTALAEAEKFHV